MGHAGQTALRPKRINVPADEASWLLGTAKESFCHEELTLRTA